MCICKHLYVCLYTMQCTSYMQVAFNEQVVQACSQVSTVHWKFQFGTMNPKVLGHGDNVESDLECHLIADHLLQQRHFECSQIWEGINGIQSTPCQPSNRCSRLMPAAWSRLALLAGSSKHGLLLRAFCLRDSTAQVNT